MVVQHWSIPISNRIQNVSELIQHPSQASKSSSSSFLFFGKSPGSSDFPRPTAPLLRPQAPESFASARHWSDVAEAHGGERDGAEVKGGEDVAEPRLFTPLLHLVQSWGTKRTIQNHPVSYLLWGPRRPYFLASFGCSGWGVNF